MFNAADVIYDPTSPSEVVAALLTTILLLGTPLAMI
jgi:hypothetical protein